MISSVSFRFVTLMLGVLCLSLPADAQDMAAWSKVISFRPETKVQEKIQARPAEADGARYKMLHIERARGNLFLQTAALAVSKLPAAEGKAMTMAALFRRIRTDIDLFVDPAKFKVAFSSAEEKSQWATDTGEGSLVVVSNVATGVTYPMALGEATTEHIVLNTMATTGSPTEKLVSGQIWINVASASPLEGCIVQVRAAFRPTMAATHDDEWKVAEEFGGLWISFIDRVRAYVDEHSGEALPQLLPPTMAYVPWTNVAKSFHTPSQVWAGVEGIWRSTEREQRFRIEFHSDGSCEFIERNAKGNELRMNLPVLPSEDPKAPGYTIERPNDRDEVLEFYDFQPGTRTAILEKKPEPSRLVLKRNSKGRLVANWYGFSITRTSAGAVSELKQPSKMPPKQFEFVQAQD
jgi:hypothetical protein